MNIRNNRRIYPVRYIEESKVSWDKFNGLWLLFNFSKLEVIRIDVDANNGFLKQGETSMILKNLFEFRDTMKQVLLYICIWIVLYVISSISLVVLGFIIISTPITTFSIAGIIYMMYFISLVLCIPIGFIIIFIYYVYKRDKEIKILKNIRLEYIENITINKKIFKRLIKVKRCYHMYESNNFYDLKIILIKK